MDKILMLLGMFAVSSLIGVLLGNKLFDKFGK